MQLHLLSFNFNRIIYILNKIFVDVIIYKITSTRVDELNNQLDLFVDYETKENLCNQIISIPEWILEKNASNIDVERYIEDEKMRISKV